MTRRLLAAAFLVALSLLPAGPVAAASAGLVVTGVQPSPGAIEFFVTGRHLPAAALAGAAMSVTADGVVLPARTHRVAATSAGAPPRAVVLVLDTSGSMKGARLTAARAAALDYATAAPPEVQLAVVAVAERATVALAPTGDRAAFAAAVSRLTAAGHTALYDGIATAEDLLDERRHAAAAAYAERRIVVLSDGADTSSRLTADRLLTRVSRADATLDAVAFGRGADPKRLGDFAAAGSGRVLSAADAPALRAAFRGMAESLSAPVLVRATVPPALSGRTTVLRVQVRVGAQTVGADVPVAFRADPAAAAAPQTFRFGGAPGRGPLVTIVVVAVAIFGAALLGFGPLLAGGPVQRRIRDLERFAPARRGAAGPADADGNGLVRAALAVSERAVRRPDRRQRLELALDRAGSPLRAAEWQLIRLGCAAGGALAMLVLLPWWCAIPAGALAGWHGAALYLRLRAARRARAFGNQLPDALQLLVGSLRSGFSLPQGLDALVRDGGEPIAGELGRALAETRLGGDLEEALDRVGERNGSQDMAWLVMAIRIQREVGGNLSETLETAVGTMRERGRLHRHVRALSAEGRLSAMILLGMPIVLGGWMFVFRRDYLRPLYTEPLGLMMLTGSVVGVVIGALWLKKLVKVEV
ncbi:tight adherence protein B [Krasilnikovia cinnamomea]|uniref:Tight adherence protein B n=1 Tax=Krasilnikovia cinnamomea TaxID=349313 RepID=A0A4Q7ZSH3_9ACTN|nr:VWA domain-containing protein [Krasilnikovia cinnamomea]RZU54130.1 tight adherence protein B [Krasilnikovia cinnamomea]